MLPYFEYRKQTSVLSLVSWFIMTCVILWFEPSFIKDVVIQDSYLPLTIIVFSTFYWTILTFSGRWKRTLLWSASLTLLIWIRINNLANFLNIILIVSFIGIWEYYWSLINKNVLDH